jgi:hypothetical protein
LLVLKQTDNLSKQGRLQCTFPKLTEANQQYVLGIAEGLKHAQKRFEELSDKKQQLPKARKL